MPDAANATSVLLQGYRDRTDRAIGVARSLVGELDAKIGYVEKYLRAERESNESKITDLQQKLAGCKGQSNAATEPPATGVTDLPSTA